MSLPPRRKRPPSEQPALPWQLPALEAADIYAVQALERGNASAAQQQRISDLVRRLSAYERMSFYPGGEDGRRASDFAEGKRWVGVQWARLAHMRPDHRAQTGDAASAEPKEE